MNNQESFDGRLEEMQPGGGRQQVRPQRPRPQPQQCPRCMSLNTKFCYYNNYKLTQPRYFCKSCKRNCRKAKRARISSSSQSHQSPPPSPPQEVAVQMQQPSLLPSQDVSVQTQQSDMKTVIEAKDLPHAMASSFKPFYQRDGAYLSSMVAVHSMNISQSHPNVQSSRVGVDAIGSSSDLGLASSLADRCFIC